MRSEQVNYTPAAVGDSQSIVVPDDEVWFVYQITNVMATASSAHHVRFQNAISFPNSPSTGQTVHCTDGLLTPQTAVASVMCDGITFPVPLPLTQGATIYQNLRALAGLNNTILQVLAAIFKG